MYITVLCKVVDNYGDIGVCWRMCRRLKKIAPQNTISLVVDNFDTFEKIEPRVNQQNVIASGAWQSIQIEGIDIYNWHDDYNCHKIFSANDGERLSIILECFQCGRPDWMEKILFEEKLQRTVQIIMIDYLTAEKYAEDFHCLKSLTRSAKVQKVNFMPGFTSKTGGLIIDDEWLCLPQWNENGPVLVFTYTMGKGLLENPRSLNDGAGSLRLSKGPLLTPLPFMPQPEWDKMMKQCSALIIRGEESMSRACLSGIPFIWQAYPQSEEYQLVKVKALLERMRQHFGEEEFEIVEKAWMCINSNDIIERPFESLRDHDDLGCLSNDLGCLSNDLGCLRLSKAPYDTFFQNLKSLRPGFLSFAQSLQKNGDLCANLMTFINKIAII